MQDIRQNTLRIIRDDRIQKYLVNVLPYGQGKIRSGYAPDRGRPVNGYKMEKSRPDFLFPLQKMLFGPISSDRRNEQI